MVDRYNIRSIRAVVVLVMLGLTCSKEPRNLSKCRKRIKNLCSEVSGVQSPRKCCINKPKNKEFNDQLEEMFRKSFPSITVPMQTNHGSDSTGLSIVSFGIGATVGVIIGILMLFIGCGIAFHYCCQANPHQNYQSPIITYRQSGLRGRNSHVVSIPLDPERRGSHVSITINGQGIPIVNYRSTRNVIPDQPPKYEDVSKVSFPVYQGKEADEEDELLDRDLPTYADVTRCSASQ